MNYYLKIKDEIEANKIYREILEHNIKVNNAVTNYYIGESIFKLKTENLLDENITTKLVKKLSNDFGEEYKLEVLNELEKFYLFVQYKSYNFTKKSDYYFAYLDFRDYIDSKCINFNKKY